MNRESIIPMTLREKLAQTDDGFAVRDENRRHLDAMERSYVEARQAWVRRAVLANS